ncbi:MAG TPA: ABC transporter permease [Puia sp.]|nr:ABC transporter permease [Puia sp.]
MLKNYIKTALRNLVRNRVSASINIGGLAIGMAVAMLIGLWIWDEVSFDKGFANHDRIAQVMQNQWLNNRTETWNSESYVLGAELRKYYGGNFKHVIMSGWTYEHLLTYREKNIKKGGNYMEPGVTDMLSLKMLQGDRNGLKDPESILLSQSTAKAVFGDEDPIGKTLTLDHKTLVKVTGVYEDLPHNSSFADLTFISPWQLFVNVEHWDTRFNNPWGASWFQTFVQIADNADMDKVSAAIRDVKLNAVKRGNNSDEARFKPVIFLHPLNKWHLYSEFRNGVIVGGRIQYVWLFGIIGIFVLLLACINFMNLSTARSEKRAREVGIRKAIGSMRGQLIAQFYSESVLIAFFAFVMSLLLMQLSLPLFNEVADKKMSVMWSSPLFWLGRIGFTLLTGLVAGSYPALYLSSFRPVKVLKGVFRAGKSATLPRKVLVVTQFAVSIILIIGTVVVFNQIEYAKGRPTGYSREGLVTVRIETDKMRNNYNAFRNDLLASGVATGVAESENPVTNVYVTNSGLTWRGKDPNLQEEFTTLSVSGEFGKTVGWQIKEGRDFSSAFASDSNACLVNETAVKYLGFKNPVGETIIWNGNGSMKIIGVVKDMVNQSPYDPARQTFFFLPRLKNQHLDVVNIRMAPNVNTHQAIEKLGAIYKKYDPSTPFEYHFVDDEYARKFANEERVGKLAGCFASLAILISCLGLFGMASFVAEQRVKEIGIRKVLGASVVNLWRLLSREFIALVVIAFVLAGPLAYYFMTNWLHNYEYRTELHWWIFGAAGLGALLVTLLTVSLKSIRAAMANPIRSLRSE